jgi:hypothetical protein
LRFFGLWPTKPRFLKEAVPKTEVLEQPHLFISPRIIFIRAEGFNTPPFRAVKKGIKPRMHYLGRTTYLVLQGEVVDCSSIIHSDF